MRFRSGAVALVVGFVAFGAACDSGGGSGSTSNPPNTIAFTGAMKGSWVRTAETCHWEQNNTFLGVTVKGPNQPADDVADIDITGTGSVTVDSNSYGTFTGTTGGKLTPTTGATVDADLKTDSGQSIHISGTIKCP